jgi:hypothetical protein
MRHWFDDLTVDLAKPANMPRRNAIAALFAGALSPKLTWAAGPPKMSVDHAQSTVTAQIQKLAASGSCIREVAGRGGSVSSVTLADGALAMSVTLSIQSDGAASTNLWIRNGSATILKLNSSATKSGSSSAKISYGTVVGARAHTLTTQDGKSFQGVADGRPFTYDRGERRTVFADGHTAPLASLDKPLASRIANLGARSFAKFQSCITTARSEAHPTTPVTHKLSGYARQTESGSLGNFGGLHTDQGVISGKVRGDASDPGWNAPGHTYSSGGTADSPDCNQCMSDATQKALDASGLSGVGFWVGVVGDIFSGGTAIAAEMAVFEAEAAAFIALCNLPGQACYPVLCGGPFEACAKGDQCADSASGICCATSSSSAFAGVVCNGICCPGGVTSCAPDGYCACPAGLSVCGDQCCPPSSQCCGGQCYTPGTQCCNGDVPCLNGSKCLTGTAGSVCCFNESLCLNAYCCGLNTCTLDGCCQQEQVCGDRCCPAGEICQNGACFKPPCPTNVAWCNGQCCPASSDQGGPIICCKPVVMDTAPFNNMNAGCHHSIACYPAPR